MKPGILFNCLYSIQFGNRDCFWNGKDCVSFSDMPTLFTTYELAMAESRRVPKNLKRSFGSYVVRLNFSKILNFADPIDMLRDLHESRT